MKPVITLVYKGTSYEIPNRWNLLTPEQFLHLVEALQDFIQGKIPPIMLRIRYVCDIMHWHIERIATDEELLADLIAIAEQVRFPLIIRYPDHEDLLDGLSDKDYNTCRRTDPFRNPLPIAQALQKVPYHYAVDLTFFAQLLPVVKIGDEVYKGYTASSSHGALTCSLTALQYIDAYTFVGNAGALPLLAAILYYPGVYNSEGAQHLADKFQQLPPATLAAISMNFQAVCNFLYTCTPFSLLTKFQSKKAKSITTDSADALYDLSADGLGNAEQVEQMNLLTYLRILRKKSIDAVKHLRAMDYDAGKIADELGLPIDIINNII